MNQNFLKSLFLLLSLPLIQCSTVRAIDLNAVQRQLLSSGVEGEVHGSVVDNQLYVLTFRSPDDFFEYVHLSLVPNAPGVEDQLKRLSRHDRVRVYGGFMDNSSPQKHIAVDKIEVIKKYESGIDAPAYLHEAKIPDELLMQNNALFLVHAVHQGGHILVVEYKDAVIPIFVKDPAQSKELARNDVVRLKFNIQRYPLAPVHLRLDETAEQPIEVVESISSLHGNQAIIEGPLVLFPKSPQVLFNVFAVLDERQDGLGRQFTLVNFEDQAVFKSIREKLQNAWDAHPDFRNGRNKLISKNVRVRAKGRFNQVDSNQANPQIILDSSSDVEILK